MSILARVKNRLSTFLIQDRGAVAVIFGVMAIPVVALAGAALDYSRASDVKAQLQGALDAAILFVAHETNLDDAQIAEIVRTQIETMVDGAHGADHLDIDIISNSEDNLLEITAELTIDTTVLGIMGVETIDIQANAAVTTDFADLEVALVLDNTGSMRHQNRIGSLRTAALDFVRIVTEDADGNNLRISLVPYTAQVNIGNDASMEQYIDTLGLSRHHAQMIEGVVVARRDNSTCRNTHYSGLMPTGEGDVQFASSTRPLDQEAGTAVEVPGFARVSFLDAYTSALRELVGVNAANASSTPPTTFPSDYLRDGYDDCFIVNPLQISYWDVYRQLDGVNWKGCVEARPEPFDVNDAPPDANNPDTLWVPAFWLDDDDYDHQNDWLDDRLPSNHDWYDYGEYYSVYKYSSSAGNTVDEVPSSTEGPAKNCADPILPLTDNFAHLNDRIRDMTYWSSGGTVTAQGVIWGWRTLSPTAPFMEGAPYDEARKVMVVMTDGRNELVSSSHPAFGSHYSAYGHLYSGRLPSSSVTAAREYIDDRTLEACANAKAAGIIIYTVTFGLDGNTRAMWDECATEPDMAHHVNSPSQLVEAFGTIADSVGELRLTR